MGKSIRLHARGQDLKLREARGRETGQDAALLPWSRNSAGWRRSWPQAGNSHSASGTRHLPSHVSTHSLRGPTRLLSATLARGL